MGEDLGWQLRDQLVSRDAGPLSAEYTRSIAAALDDYQLSPSGGLLAACILEPVLQVRHVKALALVQNPTPAAFCKASIIEHSRRAYQGLSSVVRVWVQTSLTAIVRGRSR